MNNYGFYNSDLIVDLNKIAYNFKSIQKESAGVACIPVLKCNAYGVGLLPVAKKLCAAGAKVIALAQVGEGVALRRAGITQTELFVLGGVPQHLFPAAVQYHIGLTLFHAKTAYDLNAECERQGVDEFPVQIKIETGLHRVGVEPGAELDALITALQNCPHLKVIGAFSHFADGEVYNSSLAKQQFARFAQALAQLEKAGIKPKLQHICNSGASEWFATARCTAMRIGRRLYMDSQDHAGEHGEIAEACSWRASITNLRTIQPGETIGYDGAWIAQRTTKVAIICVGYGDGLCPQAAAAHAPVLVADQRAPLIGTCMDQSFVDVTEIECAVGDEVTLFGTSSTGAVLSAQEVAKFIGNEGVYLTNLLTDRVQRVYIGAE